MNDPELIFIMLGEKGRTIISEENYLTETEKMKRLKRSGAKELK